MTQEIAYRTNHPAARRSFDAEYLACPAPERRWVAFPVFLVFSLSGIELITSPDAVRSSIFVAAALASFAVAFSWRAGVTVNGGGLAWGHTQTRRRVTWDDVASVRFRRRRFVVRTRVGETFSIGMRWSNVDAFARAVLACLSRDRIADVRTHAMLETLSVCPTTAIRSATRIEAATAGSTSAQSGAIARWEDNPFFVLGVGPDCSRAEAERAGEKLLALLAVGASAARTSATPFGTTERTPERVRTALAELRDPYRRLVHEVWARMSTEVSATTTDDPAKLPWKEAMQATGWRSS